MKSAEDIKRYFQKATLSTNPDKHEAIFEKIRNAQEPSMTKVPVSRRFNKRRTIMKSPITKLAAAAVIIAVVFVGVSQFGGSATGVAWGEVIGKLEASRGLICRRTMTSSNRPGEDHRWMIYSCQGHTRTDWYEANQLTGSLYRDYNARTMVRIEHDNKRYFRHPMSEQMAQEHRDEISPKVWAQKFLSCECRKLGQKTIKGILCEGLETTDPTVFGDSDPPADSAMMQLWVSVETGYPVLFEGNAVLQVDDGVRIEVVLDQFQWDVELGCERIRAQDSAGLRVDGLANISTETIQQAELQKTRLFFVFALVGCARAE
jgi:hypothetical protein